MFARLTALPFRFPRLAALLAGLASATGFAPLGLWPVTLAALALLLALLAAAPTRRRAFLVGWLFGLGHFTLGLNWIATAFTYQAAMPAWLGWVAVLLLSLYLAVFPAVSALIAQITANPVAEPRSRALTLALAFAASWIVAEWLRSWLFTGFAWNPLAAIAPFAAAPTIWIGSYGQSGVAALLAGAVWLAVSHHWRPAALLALPPLALTAAATLAVDQASHAPQPRPVPVTVVQPNIDQSDKWDMAARTVNFARLAGLSRRAATAPPRLLLWPEAAVPDYLEGGYPLDWYLEPPAFTRARLAGLLGPGDLMLTGAVKLEPNSDRTDVLGARNSLFVLDRQGRLGPRYDKAHLVPYGEYLPMRPILSRLGLSRLVPGSVDFWPGPGAGTLDLGAFGRVGIQICYEIIFSGQVVDRTDRPDFIFNPSNDAWFGAWGPPQHLAQARLRALEEGLPVVRATPTGISAIIDASGRVTHSIPMHRAGRIDATIPRAHMPTLFARNGNLLSLAFAALLMALSLLLLARHRTSG